MDKESQIVISKILKYIDNEEGLNINNPEEPNLMTEYIELSNILKTDNSLHSILSKNLNSVLLSDILNSSKQKQNKDPNKQRIKYRSQINIDEMDTLINFSLWKNAPNTSNLFSTNENKRNNLNSKIPTNTGNSNWNYFNNYKKNINKNNNDDEDEETTQVNKKYQNKFTYYKNKKNNIEDDDEEQNNVTNKFHQTNTYMNNQVNLKRKK
jgi:hypothetical protein